jgi:hypothetical protein
MEWLSGHIWDVVLGLFFLAVSCVGTARGARYVDGRRARKAREARPAPDDSEPS